MKLIYKIAALIGACIVLLAFTMNAFESKTRVGEPPYIFTLLLPESRSMSGEPLHDLVFELVDRAFKTAPDPKDQYENVIIVEQKEYWIVALNVRGNGKVVRDVDGKKVTPAHFGSNHLVVLDKKTLGILKNPSKELSTWNPTNFWRYQVK